jgi:DNA invertase Pin-like site-specific DNA recombinase
LAISSIISKKFWEALCRREASTSPLGVSTSQQFSCDRHLATDCPSKVASRTCAWVNSGKHALVTSRKRRSTKPLNNNNLQQLSIRAAIYTRVSTTDQNAELQVRGLNDYATKHGWEIVETYSDVMSGAKASRPGLNRLMADAMARKFDCLLVWKLDRFGRSLVDCLNNIRTLEDQGIRFIAVTQNLDTDQPNPASRFLLHVLAAAAEFERSLIRERTLAGRLRYRQDFESGKVGKTVYSRSGRNLPPHRPKKVFDREEVVRLLYQGRSYRHIARTLGIGTGTVVRTLQARSKSS